MLPLVLWQAEEMPFERGIFALCETVHGDRYARHKAGQSEGFGAGGSEQFAIGIRLFSFLFRPSGLAERPMVRSILGQTRDQAPTLSRTRCRLFVIGLMPTPH